MRKPEQPGETDQKMAVNALNIRRRARERQARADEQQAQLLAESEKEKRKKAEDDAENGWRDGGSATGGRGSFG